jgi:hypothetical protein
MAEMLSSLWQTWQKYKEFEESPFYDYSVSLAEFVEDWETRLESALSAGLCSDPP